MDTVILHPTDGSPAADKALDYAIKLAVSADARLILLHVQQTHGRDIIPAGAKEFERIEKIRLTEADVLRRAADAMLAHAEQKCRSAGVLRVEPLISEGDPVGRIIETAKKHGVDTIVMGSRGLGDFAGLLLGSVSHKIAQLAPCTCIIVR